MSQQFYLICFRFILAFSQVLIFINSFGQSNNQIKVCIQSSEIIKDYKIQLIKIIGTKEKLVIQKNISTECTYFKIENNTIYRILVQSDCCSAFTLPWKADTLNNDYAFDIRLKEKNFELKEVIIKQKKDRFERSGDTLFVNVSDTDTRPHAAASTLFDRITGLNSSFGIVSVLGENVQEITIDGKRIFGGAASLTLDNIKANMIERMEFVEKTLANGQKQNVLNLKLKANRKDGIYGDTGVGLGTNQNYVGNGNFNKITKKGFINAFSTANSINERGIDPKTIERISMNSFRNALNASSSVIGLYEPRTQTENNIERLGTNLRGTNKYFDSGINFTFSEKKLEFDGFIFGNLNRQVFIQDADKTFFFNNITQNISSNLNDLSKARNVNANFNLRWNPSARTSLRASSQLNKRVDFGQLNDSTITDFENQNLKNIIFSKNQSNLRKSNHSFQFSLVQKGKKGGVVSSFYYQLNKQIDSGEKQFSNFFENPLITFVQNQALEKQEKNAVHNVQVVHSMPLSSQFLIEGKLKGIFENYSVRQNTDVLDAKSDLVFKVPMVNKLNNNLLETAIYVLYKRPKLDIISGFAYWNWHIDRQTKAQIYLSNPSFLLNPFTKVEYKTSIGKLSARFAKEPVLPNSMQTLTPADSSNLNNIFAGNIGLGHYYQKSFDLAANLSARKGYQFNINFNYKILENAVINENLFQPKLGVFSSSFVNVAQPTSNWNLNLSAFQIKLKSDFSWFLLGGVFRFNSFIKTQNEITELRTNYAFLNFNSTLKLKKGLNIRANWQSQFNILQSNSILNNTLNLKSEIDLGHNWYFDSGIRLNINKSQTINTQLFADTEVSKFLLKNNSMKVSLILKNILNSKNEITVEQANNYQSVVYTNFLPRIGLLKLTFYPETWKK